MFLYLNFFFFTIYISSVHKIVFLKSRVGTRPLGSLSTALLRFAYGGWGGAAPSTLCPLGAEVEAVAPGARLAHLLARFSHSLNDCVDRVKGCTDKWATVLL